MAKTSLSGQTSIPANSTVNVLSGSRFENVNQTGLLTLLAAASATGLVATLFVANRNSVEEADLGSQNRMPIIPDDVVIDDVEAYSGEKIQLNVTNTTAGALTAFWKLILDDSVSAVY